MTRVGWRRADRVRRVRLALLVLFSVAFAQVLWWIFDQTEFQHDSQQQVLAGLERESETAQELLGSDDPEQQDLGRRLLDADARLERSGSRVAVSAETLETFERQRRRRINRYLWEGGFFLVVLGLGMAILWRVLRQEAQLRKRQENFLAAVSHELKSPLASLRLAVESLSRRELARGQQIRWLDRSLVDLDRLEGLVGNLLETSRLESNRVELMPRPVDLWAVVDAAIRDLDRSARDGAHEVGEEASERPGRVRNEVPEGAELFADPVAVATVVRNLIDNALKATEKEGEVTVSCHEDERVVTVEVADTGVGFDPDESERLFEKFYRPGDELRRGTPGTGLGLYLVRRFAELGGGSVSAESAGKGRGARFEVRWPRLPETERSIERAAS